MFLLMMRRGGSSAAPRFFGPEVSLGQGSSDSSSSLVRSLVSWYSSPVPLCRTIVVGGIPGWSTRVEYQGVHGGVSDGNKVMGHVGMCEDTTSERELRKTGMSSLSRISLSCLVLSINLIHCGNEFRNSVPVRTLGL